MHDELIHLIHNANPWLENDSDITRNVKGSYVPRLQTQKLLLPEWDHLWLVLVGPRQSGKTTLGKHLSRELIKQGRFRNLLFLNCDSQLIREWIKSPVFIDEAIKEFGLDEFILFLDEVQRLENPGLLLKEIVDLKLPIKLIASGSSQLELRSHVQEYLTGRHLECLVLPMSLEERKIWKEQDLIYGTYPGVLFSEEKELLLRQLFSDYISKDIIEILKVGKADVMQKLITLVAHSAGQLVNYQQLATDCGVTSKTIQHYCSILEQTYVINAIKPFVGNKRKEIVSNPIYYFIDNGFRNQALRRFSSLKDRSDTGLLIENSVFQEIFKCRAQHFLDFDILYWRTQSKAEIDFILYKNDEVFVPVEVKYRNMTKPTIPRSFRSFVEAYKPTNGYIITKDYNSQIEFNGCDIKFVSVAKLFRFIQDICEILK